MRIIEVTPIRITATDTYTRGVSTKKGMQQFPTTPYLLEKLGIEVPKGFLDLPIGDIDEKKFARLRPYQIEDVKKLVNRAAGIIASDPRTGKTPTAISVFRAKGLKKYIVVVPASIQIQWVNEISNWTEGELTANALIGTKPKRAKQLEEFSKADSGVLIMSYEMLKIEHDRLLKIKGLEGIIIDEGHKAKNHKSKTFEALKKFRSLPHRLWLSGTLAPNKVEEVFTALSFVVPTLFVGYYPFLEYFFHTEIEKNWVRDIEYTVVQGIKNTIELPQLIGRYTVQRLQRDVMDWLPELETYNIPLQPNKSLLMALEQMEQDFEVEGTDIIAQGVLDQITRLRQLAVDPGVLGLDIPSVKTEFILNYIKDYPEKQILIFSNFSEYLKRLAEQIPGCGLIIGETKVSKREVLKNLFQDSKIKVLLINIKAGKEGLTLDNADVAIFTDVFPPAADIVQARNRITSTRPDNVKDKTIYNLYIKDSYDAETYNMVENNITSTDVINNYKRYLERKRNK